MLICQDFFTAGEIVKQNTIEKGMKNLRSVIGFYRDTTGRTELGCHDMVEMTIILVTYPAISFISLSLFLPLSHRNVDNWVHEGGDNSLSNIRWFLWRGHAGGGRLCSHHQVGWHSQRYV